MLVSPVLWFNMKYYQKTRITSVFLQNATIRQKAEDTKWVRMILAGEGFNAKKWEINKGFQLTRSKLAIANGGLTGHGFCKGPFVKYGFLPYRHNDFIFASIAHQWGFLGCLTVLGLYVVIILCGFKIAFNNTDPFGRLLTTGILTMFVIEVFINVSMTLGVMPITGLTLPFVSYGGSSLLVSLIAVGLLNNVGRCRAFSVAKPQ